MCLSFFNRDVNCVRKFFRKRFRYEGMSWPTWRDVLAQEDEDEAESSSTGEKRVRLDLEVDASGFNRALQRELEDVSV